MNVAVLGIGLLGRATAERLTACGHRVQVYNRTPEKTVPLGRLGIEVAASPGAALAEASCALLLLSDAAAIRSVLLKEDVRTHMRGRTIIQMGTIAPGESCLLRDEILSAGGEYAEAPVLGSVAEVRDGDLLIMVGAEPAQFQTWKPLLSCLGNEPRLIGSVGKAAALKLALNQLIASHIAAFSLSVGYLQRAGVPVDVFRELLGRSALSAPMFEKKYSRLASRRYERPNFSVRHLLKDVRLFLEEAARCGLDRRSLEGVPGLLEKTIELQLGDHDYAAVFEAINPP